MWLAENKLDPNNICENKLESNHVCFIKHHVWQFSSQKFIYLMVKKYVYNGVTLRLLNELKFCLSLHTCNM